MRSPRTGSSRWSLPRRRWALGTTLAVGSLVSTIGCQAEYAGMTLPSGKYMHDDVQYFSPGPDFPWSNTQAAAQRARMQAMGMEVPPPGLPGGAVPVPPGAINPAQAVGGVQDINQENQMNPGGGGIPPIEPAVPAPPQPDPSGAPGAP